MRSKAGSEAVNFLRRRRTQVSMMRSTTTEAPADGAPDRGLEIAQRLMDQPQVTVDLGAAGVAPQDLAELHPDPVVFLADRGIVRGDVPHQILVHVFRIFDCLDDIVGIFLQTLL